MACPRNRVVRRPLSYRFRTRALGWAAQATSAGGASCRRRIRGKPTTPPPSPWPWTRSARGDSSLAVAPSAATGRARWLDLLRRPFCAEACSEHPGGVHGDIRVRPAAAGGSPVRKGPVTGDHADRPRGARLDGKAAAGQLFARQVAQGVGTARIPDPFELGHHYQHGQHAVEPNRPLDQQWVTPPCGADRCPVVAPPQQPALQQELDGAIDRAAERRCSTPGLGVTRETPQRQQGLLHRRRARRGVLVAVPAAVRPLPADQPISQHVGPIVSQAELVQIPQRKARH